MFWNKKKKYAIEFAKRVTGLVYNGDGYFAGGKKFLAYKDGDEWKGLVGYEEFKEVTDSIKKRQDLILDHLNLTYQPEQSKTEPAKLVEKKQNTFSTLAQGGIVRVSDLGGIGCVKTTPIKQDKENPMYASIKPKKRTYIKSGKYSKKGKNK